jgi:uncharacterized membrane protein
MKLKIYLIWPALGFIAMGCSNHSTSDLSGASLVGNVSYARDIKPIIDNNCLECHKSPPENGAPMPLTTYEFVKDAITNRPLLDRISREQGAEGMMPLGGTRLPQSSINLIALWKAQGMQP